MVTEAPVKNKVPAKPMQIILAQYVIANNLPLRVTRPEEFIRAYRHYCLWASNKN